MDMDSPGTANVLSFILHSNPSSTLTVNSDRDPIVKNLAVVDIAKLDDYLQQYYYNDKCIAKFYL